MGNTKNLKPFKRGQSGNPGGRPKTDVAALLAREVFAENPEAIKGGLAKALQRGDASVFKILADRAFGRLPQPVAVSGNNAQTVNIVFAAGAPDWLIGSESPANRPQIASASALTDSSECVIEAEETG